PPISSCRNRRREAAKSQPAWRGPAMFRSRAMRQSAWRISAPTRQHQARCWKTWRGLTPAGSPCFAAAPAPCGPPPAAITRCCGWHARSPISTAPTRSAAYIWPKRCPTARSPTRCGARRKPPGLTFLQSITVTFLLPAGFWRPRETTMQRIQRTLMLLLVVGIPAAASPLFAPSRDLCFTDGPLTYRLSPSVSWPDYRVRIDNTAPQPDLRVRLVDSVDLADLPLVDDIGPATCKTAGVFRTVAIVSGTADVTVSVSHEPQEADFALYV